MANEERPIAWADEMLTRLGVGGTALAAGVILWLDHLGRLNARDYFVWWPVILLAFAVTNAIRRHWVAAIMLLCVGLVFMPALPLLPHVRVWQLLALTPLLISVAGVALIVQALRPETSGPMTFRAIAVMGGNERTLGPSAAGEVPHGEVVAVMGGCEIDLTRSTARKVVIDLLVFWGGVEIKVPRGWKVVMRNAMILGASVNNTVRRQSLDPNEVSDDTPHVVITGAVIMGGVEIKNPKEVIA